MNACKFQNQRQQEVYEDNEILHIHQTNDDSTFSESTALLPIENISPLEAENTQLFCIESDTLITENNQQHIDTHPLTCNKTDDIPNITAIVEENCRDLPVGIKYHFYVSYSSDDISVVNKLIEQLEGRFFFKCLNYERDFTAGRRIDELIHEGMNQSEAVLIILSQSFIAKMWCMTEATQALEMSYKSNNKLKVIPIRINSLTDELPTVLRSIRYIDAEKEEDVAARINEVYNNPAVMNMQSVERKAYENGQNGASIWMLEAKLQKHYGILYTCNFPALSEENKVSLNSNGTNCKDQTHAVIVYANSHTLMKFFGVFNYGRPAVCACFLILIIFVCVPLALGSLIIMLQRSSDGVLSLIWMSLSAFFIGIFATCVIIGIRSKLKSYFVMSIRTGIWNINSKYYETSNCLIEFDCYDATPMLSLVRYDTSKCKEYLCILLERRTNYDEERRKELVDTLIEEKLKQLQISLFRNWLTIEESYLNVHNTWKNRKCLCQMLEKRMPCF